MQHPRCASIAAKIAKSFSNGGLAQQAITSKHSWSGGNRRNIISRSPLSSVGISSYHWETPKIPAFK